MERGDCIVGRGEVLIIVGGEVSMGKRFLGNLLVDDWTTTM